LTDENSNYRATADVYDAIYSTKDYAAEAAKIRQIIARECPGANSILDVACGTGEHAKLLAADFTVDGVDLEPKFVEIARAKHPVGNFSVGDMRTFQLAKRYDVVQCLFSAIGYMLTASDIVAALKCFRSHAAPSGIILVEPWIAPADFKVGHVVLNTVDRPDFKVCRVGLSSREGDVSVLELRYLVATPAGIRAEEEVHRLTLISPEQMQAHFAAAGLQSQFDPVGLFGRGLFIARTNDDPPGN
jgi:SAM-dependent methyltransferase